MTEHKTIGIMSGTSLDGVDVAYCHFIEKGGSWEFNIHQAETIEYSPGWKKRLNEAKDLSGSGLSILHTEYGRLLGSLARDFIKKHKLAPDFIASHGHTVFHQPDRHFTFQIGSGAEIAALTGKTVVCDFRTTDVALGGQGAPLVPVGDELLFPGYGFCLNLGGFANISFNKNNQRIAFDICPANIVLNHLSNHLGMEFDKDGLLAASGTIDETLLGKLNHINYYSAKPPKSLGAEWLEEKFLPLLTESHANIPDQLRTVVEHITDQIGESVMQSTTQKVYTSILITGGGAFNHFLIKRMRNKLENIEIIIPDKNLINYKEAMIFAFLGLLRILKQPNCLRSVTGASIDNIGGAVYLGW